MKKTALISIFFFFVGVLLTLAVSASYQRRNTVWSGHGEWVSSKPGDTRQRCVEFGTRPDGYVVWRDCGGAAK